MAIANEYSLNHKAFEFAVERIEKPLVALFGFISKVWKPPTKVNTNKYNTHLLIELRDWFLPHVEGTSRYDAFTGMFNYSISKIDRDDYYEDCWLLLLQEALKKPWIFKDRLPRKMWKDLGDVDLVNPNERTRAIVEAWNKGDIPKLHELTN